jgi:glycosyltransferase involved in cell wall biosynthesis
MSVQRHHSPLSSLSIFSPCYNEVENLPGLIKQVMQLVPKLARKFEVIIVDDGSNDGTAQLVKKLQLRYPQLKIVTHPQNLGYGSAVRTGINTAQYDWIFWTDGDGQFDFADLKQFVDYTDDFSVILGYRKRRVEGVRRAMMAKLYTLYIDLLFRVHVKDTDCGFKLFKANQLKLLKLFSNGAFISAEILYKLKKKRISFKQLPVDHLLRKFGKSTGVSPKVILIGLWEPLKLYLQMKFTTL